MTEGSVEAMEPDVPPADSDRSLWESVARGWVRAGRDALWRQHSDAVNSALVEQWVPPKSFGTVLKTDAFDEAVSAGLGEVLSSRAAHVVYVDLSLEILRSARSLHGPLAVVCCDVRQLPFAPGSIDAVVSNSTLDHFRHVDEISAGLREICRVLRPHGRLLLTLDNLANPVIALRQILPEALLRWTGLVPYFVGATLGPSRLRRFLTESGFQVERIGAILHCPRVLAVFLARRVQRQGPGAQRRFLAGVEWFERLQRWPTRYVSGHFLTVGAVKSPHAGPASPVPASGTGSSS